MKIKARVWYVCLFVLFLSLFALPFPGFGQKAESPATSLPSETPEKLIPVTDSFDYVKRDVMIPMRDGVKLHTVIVIPKGARNAPILLTRTPYKVLISGRFSTATTTRPT